MRSFLLLISLFLGTAFAADNHLVRGNFLEPESLDPHASRGVEAANILRDIYEGLVRTGADGRILPGVAERWQVSNDALEWRFELREDAAWSDGTPLTAEDFVYSLRRTLSPETASPFADNLVAIENAQEVLAAEKPASALGVVAVNDHELLVRLDRPLPYLLSLLAHHSTYPVHRESIEEHGSRFPQPGRHLSNGAYRLVEWSVNERIRLERNPHYWDAEAVRIDSVDYLPIDDEESEFNRYRAGELDITQTVPARRVADLRESMPDELHIAPYLSTYFYGFNLARQPFADNPELRRALSLVIDRDIIAGKVMVAGELPATALNPPGIEDYIAPTVEYANRDMAARIAEAKQLYRDAGYGPDKPLQIELRFNTGDNHRRVALAVSSLWRQHLGVETRLVNEEWKVFLQNRKAGEVTQVFRSSWVGDFNDPMTFLHLLESGNAFNDTGYANPEYDELLARAATAATPSKRRRLLQEAEAVMLADQPILPLYYYVTKHLVKPRVGGWQDNIMDQHATRDLYLK
ncbi:MAG: peptide ABC transporter substrate-binding protein [Gammaproteobacteria bacterium]|nr:peptide ABC transporter substrate-binding protein [Gammaproteobacteria bacterium]